MNKLNFISFLVIIFTCCKSEVNKKEAKPLKNIIAEKQNIQNDYTFLNSINLEELMYELHPYNGYPMFSLKSKNYICYITTFGKSKSYKDVWIFDELTDKKQLESNSKQQILNNKNNYNFVLLLIEKEAIELQDLEYFAKENFKFKLFKLELDKWLFKSENQTEDEFIYLDSMFREDALKIIKL